MKFFVTALILLLSVNYSIAQCFDWGADGYQNYSGGGTYYNIDNSGIDLTVSGLVYDYPITLSSIYNGVGTGINDQDSQKVQHTYTFKFSRKVSVTFNIENINRGFCYNDALVFSGSPTITHDTTLSMTDSLVIPGTPANPFGAEGMITVSYIDVDSFTIVHGGGTHCNPGFIWIHPIQFQQFLSTEELQEQEGQTTIYPNPSSGLIHIENSVDVPSAVEFFGINGSKQWVPKNIDASGDQLVVDISNFAAGIYIARVMTANSDKPKLVKVVKI